MTKVIPKILVRCWFDSFCMRSEPNQAARAAPVAAQATMRQSMSLLDVLFTVATAAVMTITASEVATACFCVRFRAPVKNGTMTMPPPIPHRAPNKPAREPTNKLMITTFI